MSSDEWPAAPIDGNLIWLAIHDGHLWKATTYQGRPGFLRRRGPVGEPDFIYSFADAEAKFGHMEPWDVMVSLDAGRNVHYPDH